MNTYLGNNATGVNNLLRVMVVSAALFATSFSVAAVETTQYRLSGNGINTYSFVADGCSYVDIGININESVTKGTGAPLVTGPAGLMWISKYNWCTWEFSWGYGEILVSKYTLKGNLSEATIVGTANLNVYDQNNNYYSIPYTLNLSVVGSGILMNGMNSSSNSYGKIRVQSRFTGSSRDGTTTGTISSGVDNYTLDGSNNWSYLNSSRAHSITISRQ